MMARSILSGFANCRAWATFVPTPTTSQPMAQRIASKSNEIRMLSSAMNTRGRGGAGHAVVSTTSSPRICTICFYALTESQYL